MKIKANYKKFECSAGIGKLAFEAVPSAKDAGELSRLQLLSTPVELSIEPIQEELAFDEQVNQAMENNCTIYELPGAKVVPIDADEIVLDGIENLDAVAEIVKLLIEKNVDDYAKLCDEFGLEVDESNALLKLIGDFLVSKAHSNIPEIE